MYWMKAKCCYIGYLYINVFTVFLMFGGLSDFSALAFL